VSTRTLSVRMEGLAIYREWAEEIIRAQQRGEPVPTTGDAEAMADWLDERNLIRPPIDWMQAVMLIRLVQAGGHLEVDSGQ
jgi:hypothetical protein